VVEERLAGRIEGRAAHATLGQRAAEVLAATGWAGMTRLARGEPAMGAGVGESGNCS